MSNPQVAILMLTSFIFLVLLGFPVAFTLMAMGISFGFYYYLTQGNKFEQISDLFNNSIFDLFAQRTFEVMDNSTLYLYGRKKIAWFHGDCSTCYLYGILNRIRYRRRCCDADGSSSLPCYGKC